MTTLRDDQQAMTRERLLRAAATLFARRGFGGASLAEIAGAAAVSTGAIYSNFAGKEDLAVAVIERHMERQAAEYRGAVAAADGAGARARAGADRWMTLVQEEPDYFPLFLEAARFSRSDPELARRFAASCEGLVRSVQAVVEAVELPGGGTVPADAAPTLALVIFALGNGLALQNAIQPGRVPAHLFGDFLEGLAVLGAAPRPPG